MGKKRRKKKKEQHPMIVFADGSADAKENAAGYGYLVIDDNNNIVEEGSGGIIVANNAFAELTAVINGIVAASQYGPTAITVFTDYKTIPTALKSDIVRWNKNGWQTAKGRTVKNAELWMCLEELAKKHKVEFCWVKGHSGNEHNSRCDFLAGKARRDVATKRKANRMAEFPVS